MSDPALTACLGDDAGGGRAGTGTGDNRANADHILVIGEALVDVVHRADGSVSEYPGGSPANVALTLGRLGRDVRLATWLGPDERGSAVSAWLAESGVTLTPGSRGAASTSVATAHLDAAGAATYDFDITWVVPAGTAAGTGTLAVHTGSIAAVLTPGADAVFDLVKAARPTATIAYDPNIRPALMGDAATTLPRVTALVELADVVKVSDEDLRWLYPGVDPLVSAQRWAGVGPALAVVTFGADGAVALLAGTSVRVPAVQAEVVDTVGAGDSFMGALLDGLWTAGYLGAGQRAALRGIDPTTVEHILRDAARVAAITVARAGANPPWRAELEPPVG